MRSIRATFLTIAAVIMALCFVPTAVAQLTSNVATVNLSQSVNSSLTISASPASLTLTGATPTSPITVTTSWNIGSSWTIDVVAYFSSATAALSSGARNIPSSAVFGSANGGTAVAFTGTNADAGGVGAGTSITLYNNAGMPSGSSSRNDTLSLSIPSAGSLVAGSYTGVLNFQAFGN